MGYDRAIAGSTALPGAGPGGFIGARRNGRNVTMPASSPTTEPRSAISSLGGAMAAAAGVTARGPDGRRSIGWNSADLGKSRQHGLAGPPRRCGVVRPRSATPANRGRCSSAMLVRRAIWAWTGGLLAQSARRRAGDACIRGPPHTKATVQADTRSHRDIAEVGGWREPRTS